MKIGNTIVAAFAGLVPRRHGRGAVIGGTTMPRSATTASSSPSPIITTSRSCSPAMRSPAGEMGTVARDLLPAMQAANPGLR